MVIENNPGFFVNVQDELKTRCCDFGKRIATQGKFFVGLAHKKHSFQEASQVIVDINSACPFSAHDISFQDKIRVIVVLDTDHARKDWLGDVFLCFRSLVNSLENMWLQHIIPSVQDIDGARVVIFKHMFLVQEG